MYEIRKVKIINFANLIMLLAVANYLIFGLIYFFIFTMFLGIYTGDSIFENIGYGFLFGYLIGLLAVALFSFLAGLLTGAVYNFISLKMNKGLQIDIAQLVEKEEPLPAKK
jgi:hypothetical protein